MVSTSRDLDTLKFASTTLTIAIHGLTRSPRNCCRSTARDLAYVHMNYKTEKSLKMKRDVGMACQKVHVPIRKDIKVKVCKYTKPHPSLYLFTIGWIWRDRASYIYLHLYNVPCWYTFWHAIPTSLFIFNDFSALFLYIFLAIMFSVMLWSKHYCNHNSTPWNNTDSLEIVQESASMQAHIGSLDPWSIVAYNAGFTLPCFYAPDFHSIAFESLEYIIHVSCQGLYMMLYKNPLSGTVHIY